MKKKVVVIDDDYPIRLLIQKVLEKDYQVNAFNNVAKAMEHINTSGYPDVIISDIKLPVIDGKDFLRNLKTSTIYKHIPVIIISSWTDDNTKLECEQAGADAYINKPFNPEKLVNILNQVVKKIDDTNFIVG